MNEQEFAVVLCDLGLDGRDDERCINAVCHVRELLEIGNLRGDDDPNAEYIANLRLEAALPFEPIRTAGIAWLKQAGLVEYEDTDPEVYTLTEKGEDVVTFFDEREAEEERLSGNFDRAKAN